MAAAMLVVLAAAFVGWRALTPDGGQLAVEVSSAASPGEALSPVGASMEDTRVVEIRALADAWLEARGPDGTVFLSRQLRAGDVYRPDPSPGWTLHARDGGAFELYVNGVSAGALGTTGMPVLGRAIDEVRPLTQAEYGRPRT